jgi:hypothetical protein
VGETVQCEAHGETPQTFVCVHLKGENCGLGFNREDPSEDNPFPDAWCDVCEIVRAEHGGWEDVPDEQCNLALLCSECYERARIRHTRPSITFDHLASLRWKCGNCDEWHTGPCLDVGFSHPHYWNKSLGKASLWAQTGAEPPKLSPTFLEPSYCSIGGEDFFIRGIIHLPIVGAGESFCWGVWGSVSRENFEKLISMENDPKRVDLPPMFSWLSSQISDYPDTLSLKMYAHIQEPGTRPHFRLERTDHPLAQQYHHGISPERVREIMLRRLPTVEE